VHGIGMSTALIVVVVIESFVIAGYIGK